MVLFIGDGLRYKIILGVKGWWRVGDFVLIMS